jgi:signal transduction histidine kinase
MGIPKEEREKIFDRYYQSSRTSLKQHGGSGIGLSFAKEMVDLHNGTLHVEDGEGGGSKFVVTLPLSQDVEVTGEHEVRETEEEPMRGSLDVAYPPEKPERELEGRLRVLAAEDNPQVAQIVYSALSSEYNTHFAPDGAKALARLQKEHFDCLVTDIMMPRMRGDELVHKLRASQKTRALPIIVLSSHADEETVTELLRGGASDYVTKPFRREVLLARVRAQIEAHKTAEWISKNEKVIELGFLAGGMAHQIRNGLNSLTNHLSYQANLAEALLEEAKGLPEEAQKKARERLAKSTEIIKAATDRIRRLTDSVQAYSSGSTQQTTIVAADAVDVAVTLHAQRIKQRQVEIKSTGLKDLKISGYAAFHEALVNLIANAVDAVKDDGTGRIEITGKDLGPEVEIAVTDNGAGIPPENLAKLCQPFFTTKSPGEGTGMGLYMVRDIVEGQHGGSLSVQSAGPGQGATFTIRVPKKAPEPVRDADVSIHNVSVS